MSVILKLFSICVHWCSSSEPLAGFSPLRAQSSNQLSTNQWRKSEVDLWNRGRQVLNRGGGVSLEESQVETKTYLKGHYRDMD